MGNLKAVPTPDTLRGWVAYCQDATGLTEPPTMKGDMIDSMSACASAWASERGQQAILAASREVLVTDNSLLSGQLKDARGALNASLAALELDHRAEDELMTEFISHKRACDWGVVNDAGVSRAKAARDIRAALAASEEKP